MLEVENIQKKYKDIPILNNVSFSLPTTGVASFVGPNGAGKTTLLGCISGMIPLNSGTIKINDVEVKSQKDTYQQISFFSNESILIDELTGTEHMILLNPTQLKIAEHYVELFGAHSFFKKKIKKYSLGMKQILIIILTISLDTKILIFDEAMNGLDPKNRQAMIKTIQQLKEDKLILFSSHILHDVVELSDQILFLNQGIIEQFDTIDELNLTELYMKKVGGII